MLIRACNPMLRPIHVCKAPTFAQLKRDVADALVECEDITLYLEPIRPLVDEMEQTDFIDVPQLFEQILHLLTLVYVQSKHYNTPRKMSVRIFI